MWTGTIGDRPTAMGSAAHLVWHSFEAFCEVSYLRHLPVPTSKASYCLAASKTQIADAQQGKHCLVEQTQQVLRSSQHHISYCKASPGGLFP